MRDTRRWNASGEPIVSLDLLSPLCAVDRSCMKASTATWQRRLRDNLSLCGMQVWYASANRECQRQFRLCINELASGPGEIRTHDLCLRRQSSSFAVFFVLAPTIPTGVPAPAESRPAKQVSSAA